MIFNVSKKKITFAILLLVLAAALIALAFFPQASFLKDIPIWKLLIAAIILYLFFMNLLFGENAAEHFNVFWQIALMFLLFEKNIAAWIGREGEDLVNTWLIVAIAVTLTVAEQMLFSSNTAHKNKSRMGNVTGINNDTDSFDSALSDSVIYFDVAKHTKFYAKNKLGDLVVYFQNTDAGDRTVPITLTVNNSLGDLTINVPDDWNVVCQVDNPLGDVSIRTNPEITSRTLIIRGNNSLGDLTVR